MAHALHVLYEDRHVLAVLKPARLLTASDKTGDATLLELARAYHGGKQEEGKKGYLVPLHFLDRPVSGVVLFAVSSKAASRLSAQFRAGTIHKTYRAVVEGAPATPAAEVEDWLLKDEAENTVRAVRSGTPGAKHCALGFRQLAQHGGLTLLDVQPHTGRSHQIRVQLSSRGLPIYGDVKYGARHGFDNMIALHAYRISFDHPVTKERVTLTAPLPAAWAGFWPDPAKDYDV